MRRDEWIWMGILAALTFAGLYWIGHEMGDCRAKGGVYLQREAVCVRMERIP